MKPEAILPLHVDSTMISCARQCLEKFRLEFVFGLRPPGVSIDLHAGGCFATALEVCYKEIWEGNRPLADALQRAHAAFTIAWGDFEIPAYKKTSKTFDRVWEAVESYFREYPPLTDHVKPYFVDRKPCFEYTFAIPLEPTYNSEHTLVNNIPARGFPLHPSGDPFIYCGRFDMLGAYAGKPVVRDEKTTGRSISTGWSEQWNLRSQFLGYVWACQQGGLNLDSVCVRGVAIQKTMITHAEALKTYSDYMVARWHEQLRRDLWRIRRAWDEGYFDYNFGEACTAYGNCIFMDVCQSREKENWYNQFKVSRWNPLLKNPIAGPVEAVAA